MSSAKSSDTGKLRRAKGKLKKKLRQGFARVVFAAPGQQEGEDAPSQAEVHEAPTVGPQGLDDAEFNRLFKLAESAAVRGLVKHTWVLDETRRIEVDARHGFLKTKTLDAATVEKVMGGKDRALRPDRSGALLRAIGIMNADGSIPARRAKKYKQVNHLVELARPSLAYLHGRTKGRALRVLDLACGNAYLSFVLAETLRLENVDSVFAGVDLREDLVTRCRERAAQLDFAHMHFACATIREAFETTSKQDKGQPMQALGGQADLLLALHACDTATDEAIAAGIVNQVPAMMVVPCCQAELARELSAAEDPSAPVKALTKHGRLRRAYADLLTDALRVEVLEAAGYEVAVVEFVSTEHSAKNTLLRAHRRPNAKALDATSLAPVRTRCEQLGVSLALVRQLEAAFG